MEVRPCSVAGMFYPRDPDHLEQLLERMYRGRESDRNARGVIAPHAGYLYSGELAARAFGAIPSSFSGTFLVIGPSHRGYLTCTSRIAWETPLGLVDVDRELVDALDVRVDEDSHTNEHSIEVQLPLLKYRFPRAGFAPLMMGEQSRMSARVLADRILDAMRTTGKEIRLVASSDFSHYVPRDVAERQDRYAIDALTTLDVPEFYRRIEQEGVSACGYGPIAVLCMVCQERGATRGELLEYRTSGDVTGEFDRVVGYGAIAVI